MQKTPFCSFALGQKPTIMEKRVIASAAAGVAGVNGSLSSLDDGVLFELEEQGGSELRVSAKLIRALITDQFYHPDWPNWALHESGLEIEHAIIAGDFECIGINFARSLSFTRCWFLGAFSIYQSQVNGSLLLNKCVVPRWITLAESRFSGNVKIQDCEYTSSAMVRAKHFASFAFRRAITSAVEGYGPENGSSAEEELPDNILENSTAILEKLKALPEEERAPALHRVAECYADAYINERFEFDRANGFDLALSLERIEANSLLISGNGYSNIFLQDATVSSDVVGNATISGKADFTDAEIGRDLDLGAFSATRVGRGIEQGAPEEPVTAAATEEFALILRGAQVKRRLRMPRQMLHASTDLSNASCNILDDCAESWPVDVRDNFIHLNGLTYSRIEHPEGMLQLSPQSSSSKPSSREKWLLCQPRTHLSEDFNPQPWKQAAAALSADGYEQAAKFLTIRRRVAERHSNSTPRLQKFINLILHAVADYGFNPWKTVACCLIAVALFAGIFEAAQIACASNSLCATQNGLFLMARFGDINPEIVNEVYPRFSSIEFSLGTFVPLFELASESFWRVNTRAELACDIRSAGFTVPLGSILYWTYVLERILGAILVAIAITGFTGMLARDP